MRAVIESQKKWENYAMKKCSKMMVNYREMVTIPQSLANFECTLRQHERHHQQAGHRTTHQLLL
jgi:hypothetical protein